MCPTPVSTEAPGLYLKLKKGSSGHRGTKSHQNSGRRLRWNSFVSLIHVNCVTWCLSLLPGFWISYKGSWFVGVSLREERLGFLFCSFVDLTTQNWFFLWFMRNVFSSSEWPNVFFLYSFGLLPWFLAQELPKLLESLVLTVLKMSCDMWMRWLLRMGSGGWIKHASVIRASINPQKDSCQSF